MFMHIGCGGEIPWDDWEGVVYFPCERCGLSVDSLEIRFAEPHEFTERLNDGPAS